MLKQTRAPHSARVGGLWGHLSATPEPRARSPQPAIIVDFILLSYVSHAPNVSASRARRQQSTQGRYARAKLIQALARRLKELREHAKISLAEVAAAIGVTKATVWQYERGRRRISALRLQGLARALYLLTHAPRIAATETKHSPAAANGFNGMQQLPLYRRIVGDKPAILD